MMNSVGLKGALSVCFLFLVIHRFFQSERLPDGFSFGEAVCKPAELEILRWRGAIVRRYKYLNFRDGRSSRAVIVMLLLCSGDVETNPGPREIGEFACPCCGSSIAGTLGDLLRHFRLFHADSSHFFIQCNLQGCQRTFRNFHTFRNHAYSRNCVDGEEHLEDIHTTLDGDHVLPDRVLRDPVVYSGVSFDNDSTDEETETTVPDEVDHLRVIQKAAATWILKVF